MSTHVAAPHWHITSVK